jgi:hypothetical protein
MAKAGRKNKKIRERAPESSAASAPAPKTPAPGRGFPPESWLLYACLAGPFLLMVLLAWTPGISFTEDLGRHLLLGKIISEGGSVPGTNYLTYTFPDFPFVNHHWLSEVIFYQLHRFAGYNGLILWKMLVMGLTLALALAAVRPRRGQGFYWLAALLSAVILGYRSHIRPELFTYLGIALYLWSFERIRRGSGRYRWVVTAYALLWANTHIYFIFGVGMAGAFMMERLLADRSRESLVREGGWFALLAAVSCLNPQGLKGFLYPLQIFSNYSFDVLENQSPLQLWERVVNPMLIALPLVSAGLLTALAVLWRRRAGGRGTNSPARTADVIIAVTALAASWGMARSTPLLALAALPVMGAALTPPTGEPAEESLEGEGQAVRKFPPRRILSLAVPALALVLNLWLIQGIVSGWYVRVFPSPIGPTPFGFDDEERFGRLRQLADTIDLEGPLFSDFKIGSLVEYQLYPEPGYVDNRPEAYPGAFWRTEYNPALALKKDWERVRDARGFNAVIVALIGVREFFIQELVRRPSWALVHLDELSAVWLRRNEANAAAIAKAELTPTRIDAYEKELAAKIAALPEVPWWRRQIETKWAVHGLYSLICIGEYSRAWPYLWELHLAYPDYQIVHELMRVTVPRDEQDKVIPVIKRRAHWPLAVKQVLDYGDYLLKTGEVDEARGVYRRGQIFFPLAEVLGKRIEQIEDREYLAGEKSSS